MDIFEKLKAKIVEKIDCDPSKVTRDTSLIGLGIDSLDTVEMIMDLDRLRAPGGPSRFRTTRAPRGRTGR